MQTISSEQMAAFRRMRVREFQKGVLGHVRKFFPEHWRAVGERLLGEVVELGVERARRYGLSTERELYLYIGMMLYLGSYFDEDPVHFRVSEHLNDNSLATPYRRAEKAMDETLAWLDRVFGPGDENVRQALQRIAKGIPSRFVPKKDHPDACDYIPLLMYVFPEKLREIPAKLQQSMVQSAMEKCRMYGFESIDEKSLAVVGEFMLGKGFDVDPQFAWIGRNLRAGTDAKKRMKLLVKEMFEQIELWLA